MQKDLEIAAFVSSNYQQKELEKREEKMWRQDLKVLKKQLEVGVRLITLALLAGSMIMLVAVAYETWFA